HRLSVRSRAGARGIFRRGDPDGRGICAVAVDAANPAADGGGSMILKVARLGHPVLREKASDLEVKDIKAGKFRPLIDDMIETMHAYEGVGLAGPQVHLPLGIFVFEVEERVPNRRATAKLGGGLIFNATYEPIGTDTITD